MCVHVCWGKHVLGEGGGKGLSTAEERGRKGLSKVEGKVYDHATLPHGGGGGGVAGYHQTFAEETRESNSHV